MCGIAGFFNSEKRELSKKILFNFSKTLNHRGPDNSGIYYNKYIGLSHNRLSIIDLSDNGNQPITDGENWLVYNGEIYNYKQLKEDLIKKSFTFSSNSDSEVLFKAIKHYGIPSTLNKLEGIFAFAFYNSKNKQITLARDGFGIKPLFYTIRNNTLYFASELKALVKELKFEIDQFRTIYSVFGIAEKSRYETIYKDLYHLYLPFRLLLLKADAQSKTKMMTYLQLFQLLFRLHTLPQAQHNRPRVNRIRIYLLAQGVSLYNAALPKLAQKLLHRAFPSDIYALTFLNPCRKCFGLYQP